MSEVKQASQESEKEKRSQHSKEVTSIRSEMKERMNVRRCGVASNRNIVRPWLVNGAEGTVIN